MGVGSAGNYLTAIDYKTGKIVWRRPYPSAGGNGGGGGGLLTTAGGLVFAGDAGGNIVAYDAATGAPLWHSHIGNVTAPPQTYMLDGRQYLLVAIGDKLYPFTLDEAISFLARTSVASEPHDARLRQGFGGSAVASAKAEARRRQRRARARVGESEGRSPSGKTEGPSQFFVATTMG